MPAPPSRCLCRALSTASSVLAVSLRAGAACSLSVWASPTKPAPAERGEPLAFPRAPALLLHVQALEELWCPAWARLRRPPTLQLVLCPGTPAWEALCCCSSQCLGRAGTFWRSWPFCLDDNRSSRPAPCSAFDDQMRSYSRGYRSVFSPNESCVTMARSELQHMTQWVKQLGAAVKGRLGNRAEHKTS